VIDWISDRIAKAHGIHTARFYPPFRCLHDAVVTAPMGALVECGVYRGASLMGMARLRPRAVVYGLDWFKGLPDPGEHDAAGCKAGMYPSDGAWIRRRIDRVGLRNIKILDGLFTDTLGQVEGEIAVLHLDCDLYAPHVECMEALLPMMASGGRVVMDDYNDPLFGAGVQKAVRQCAPWAKIQQHESGRAWFAV
jgi:hypothetical protein